MTRAALDSAVAPLAGPADGGQHLRLRLGEETLDLRFRATPAAGAISGDVGFALALLPAMKLGGRLRVEPDLSPRLAAAAGRVQDLFLMWERSGALPRQGYRRIDVAAVPRTAGAPAGAGVGCFFSGGVDSFYTLFTRRDEITDLVLVHGFDVPLEDRRRRAQVSEAARAVAEGLGKRLIEVETDARRVAERYLDWHHFFGAGLASVALFLAPALRTIYMPGGHTYANLVPDGSHPLLDPLWSTESLEVVYHGLEATRTDKLERLASEDLAMRWLRVCWKNRDGAYNCGRCEKCLRTRIGLHAVGAGERCATLGGPLDLDAVRVIEPGHARTIWAELLHDLEARDADPALVAAVREVAGPPRTLAARAWRRLGRAASRLGGSRPGG